MGREVMKTPDTKLRSNTRRHDGQEPTLLQYATQNVVRALTYAVQGPARTLTPCLGTVTSPKCAHSFTACKVSIHRQPLLTHNVGNY